MNNADAELERWLVEDEALAEQYPATEDWIAGFDADRQVVLIKLGPYQKLYLRPQKFTKRFYHRLFPLKIESWPYRKQLSLFKDFCSIDIVLNLRFQATLSYAQRNSELLASIDQHIKHSYADQIEDLVHRALENLHDGKWVQTGLFAIEKNIANSICELLAMQQIQSEASCRLDVKFADFPDVAPGPDNVYLHVLKKSFEISDQKNREILRQQRLQEKQELHAKQLHLQHEQEMTELALQEQAQQAERTRRLLTEKQNQLVEQLAIEKVIFAEQLSHEARLKEMQLDNELRTQELLNAKQRLAETQQMTELLAHQTKLDEQKFSAEMSRRQNASKRPPEVAPPSKDNDNN